MAKRPPLSTGTVKSKCFDFTLDDDDFEEHTRGFYQLPLLQTLRSA